MRIPQNLMGLVAATGLVIFIAACNERKQPPVPKAKPTKPIASVKPRPPIDPAKFLTRPTETWKAFDAKVKDRKYEAAFKLAAGIADVARAKGDDSTLTQALIEQSQLRIALGGFEKAVRFLREQKWPSSPLGQIALELYYASALQQYHSAYSWEIRKRERTVGNKTLALKKWTSEQIIDAAIAAWKRAWKQRDMLSTTPQKALGKYLQKNNYPESVRGTLRDALSYLAVNLLANSNYFTAAESNSVYRLGFEALLQPRQQASISIDDESQHPLLRALAVLDDLETWHARSGRRQAALEARLQRYKTLRGHFTKKAQRQLVRDQLGKFLSQYRDVPWWAMGQARLAQMYQSDLKDNVQARKIAEACAKAYPNTPGGKECAAVVSRIDAPEFRIRGMASDGPRKRSIQVKHKNLTKLYFRAYAVNLDKRMRRAKDYNLLESNRDMRKRLKREKPTIAWTADLPATPDYQRHVTYVVPPLDKPGLYVVMASAESDFRESNNRIIGTNLIISDLVVVSRRTNAGTLEVQVFHGKTGTPAVGATAELWKRDWRKGHRPVASRRTNADGDAGFSRNCSSCFIVARKGADIVLDKSHLYLYRNSRSSAARGALMYTDRSIYRPGQTLQFKLIAYRGDSIKGRYRVVSGQRHSVSLFDSNGQVVKKLKVRTNAFGSASGSILIPTGRKLGSWSLRASPSGYKRVRVEEYKRPTFEVALDPNKGEPQLNKPVTVRGRAKYYFGLPVTGGKIKWRVLRSPVYPWWYRYWGYAAGSASETIATGHADLDGNGRFKIAFTPTADKSLDNKVSYRYAVSCDVTDEGGETRSASRGFRVGFTSIQAHLALEGAFALAGKPTELSVKRTNLDGVGKAGKGRYRLFAIEPPAKALLPAELPRRRAKAKKGKFQTKGDARRARWETGYDPRQRISRWKDGKKLAEGELVHDEKGGSKLALGKLPAGAYRVRYDTKDSHGNTFETWHDFVVVGPKLKLPLASVLLQQGSVSVGKTARFWVKTALEAQTAFLDIYRRGKRISRRRINTDDPALIEMPITAAHRGGFSMRLTLVRDHQLIERTTTVYVPWNERKLKLTFSTFRDKLRPGAKERFEITVKGHDSKAAAAEVLAYMYDRSLDVFAPHSAPSVLSLYPYATGLPWGRSSLGQASPRWVRSSSWPSTLSGVSLHQDSLLFHSAYGIGGMGYRNGHGHGYGRGRYQRFASRTKTAAEPAAAASPKADMPKKAQKAKDRRNRGATGAVDGLLAQEASGEKKEGFEESKKGEGRQSKGVRKNFAETAFFVPHVRTDKRGVATVEFQVPDSVTSWNVWAHAVTRDLRGGSVRKEARSVKELLVRPYVPRFFREDDRATIKIAINNAGEKVLRGTAQWDIIDTATNKSVAKAFAVNKLSAPFAVDGGKGTTLSFSVRAPRRVGQYAIRVTAKADDFADGELRPLPVLPSRYHLMQSRFITLRNKEQKKITFADLKQDDPTRINERFVVTLDSQLFYGMLKSLPYLVNYPYACVEQTLNRFLSTGIVSSLYQKYPAIAKMARQFSKRKTRFERFDQPDANRRMQLEEAPWLNIAKGGGTKDLLNVLDSRIALRHRRRALYKLRKAQTSLGAFPWFPGGPPSPYMTLYLMHGFAKAAEFGVPVPKDIVQKGWRYLARHFRKDYADRMLKKDCCWEFLTHLNYVASSYPDASYTGNALTLAERKRILDHSFKHWRSHSPYLKGMLALTLKRMNRAKDAKLVFASVMDSAKTSEDKGTYWAPEDRSWLWYNDTIESHAFAVRVLLELEPKHPKIDGLVLWLMLNKKLNHWKSTRATSEVLYSLAQYLKANNQLAVREAVNVAIGDETRKFVFEPDRYVGKTQIVKTGKAVDALAGKAVTFTKKSGGTMFASATWHFSTAKLPKQASSDFFGVTRTFYRRVHNGKEWTLTPIKPGAKIAVGDQVEVHLSIKSKHAAEYVHLRDPRGAGFEPQSQKSRWKYDLGLSYFEEVRDSGANFFFERLPVGQYTFKYRLRANMAGAFRVGPATLQSLYAPEFAAYSAGHELKVQ